MAVSILQVSGSVGSTGTDQNSSGQNSSASTGRRRRQNARMSCGSGKQEFTLHYVREKTRSSAIADGPRDASCQLKSCELDR